MKIVKYGTYF